jgi:hypothetical protein
MKEESCSDADTGLAPMSSLCVVSIVHFCKNVLPSVLLAAFPTSRRGGRLWDSVKVAAYLIVLPVLNRIH